MMPTRYLNNMLNPRRELLLLIFSEIDLLKEVCRFSEINSGKLKQGHAHLLAYFRYVS